MSKVIRSSPLELDLFRRVLISPNLSVSSPFLSSMRHDTKTTKNNKNNSVQYKWQHNTDHCSHRAVPNNMIRRTFPCRCRIVTNFSHLIHTYRHAHTYARNTWNDWNISKMKPESLFRIVFRDSQRRNRTEKEKL